MALANLRGIVNQVVQPSQQPTQPATTPIKAKYEEVTYRSISLLSLVSKNGLIAAGNAGIVEKVVPGENLPRSDSSANHGANDLFERVHWHLEWKVNQQPFDYQIPREDRCISLFLKCIPKPEFINKLDDIWITIGFTLYSDDPSDVIHDVPSSSVRPIKLTKQAQYRCVLIQDHSMQLNPVRAAGFSNYLQNIQVRRFGTHIGAKLMIIHAGCPSSDTLRNDLGALLSFDSFASQNKFNDVKLVASAKDDSKAKAVEFPAHKLILAARSPVFEKMFEHKMQERVTNEVKVEDIHPDVLREMLIYIYTGRVPRIGEESMAYDLLYAADKYQLDHLKSLCEQQIICSLQVKNAPRAIQLAHFHNAPELKRVALRFICKNSSAVRATKEWEQVKQCPEIRILDEVIEAMHMCTKCCSACTRDKGANKSRPTKNSRTNISIRHTNNTKLSLKYGLVFLLFLCVCVCVYACVYAL